MLRNVIFSKSTSSHPSSTYRCKISLKFSTQCECAVTPIGRAIFCTSSPVWLKILEKNTQTLWKFPLRWKTTTKERSRTCGTMPNCYAKPGGPSVAKMATTTSKAPRDLLQMRDRQASGVTDRMWETDMLPHLKRRWWRMEEDGETSAPIGNFPPFWEFMTDRPTNQPTNRQAHRKVSLPIVYGIPV